MAGSSTSSCSARVVITAIAALVFTFTLPSTANAQIAGPWGACGRTTDEQKVVHTFPSSQGPLTLRCGGPLSSPEPRWGFRHLLWKHKGDFEGVVAGTFQNWRDIADLAMQTIAQDPYATYSAGGNQTCRSRVLFLKNLRTNQVVRQGIFVMFTDNGSNRINTVYPRNFQCEPR